jgi:hypothetical protein
MVVTTSGAAAAENPTASVATRKRLKFTDIIKMAKNMNKQKVKKSGRYILLPSQLYFDLFEDGDVTQYQIVGGGQTTAIGYRTDFRPIYGFTVMLYEMDVYANGSAGGNDIQEPGTLITDLFNYVGIAWQSDFVSYAKGGQHVYVNSQDPEYYGDVVNADLIHGAHRTREDAKGVGYFIQGE